MLLQTLSEPSRSTRRPAAARVSLPTTEQLLVDGGDARLALDPSSRVNRYGCRPFPDPGLAAFGSSTSSVVSAVGFAAAESLRQRLLRASAVGEPQPFTYRCELQRLRRELIRLCGLADFPGVDIVFAASGTDLHQIAAQLVAGESAAPLRVLMTEVAETGSGVPAAFAAGVPGAEVIAAPARDGDGAARPARAVAADIEALTAGAVEQGARVLLTIADVSKTGLLSPRLDHVLDLRDRWSGSVEVLVDACQFRLAPATLRAYLRHGLMVAVTGSKFLTGPAFSGALFVPPSTARRLRRTALRGPRGLSRVAEWPQGWAAAHGLPDAANYGLLLRWEAAIAELRAFRRLAEAEVTHFVADFAAAVQRRFVDDPQLEALAAPGPDRRPVAQATSWDHLPTIFPFLLRRGTGTLSSTATEQVYRRLRALRCQLGQPVVCGHSAGQPVSALRLCLSSRLIVEAVGGGCQAAVIERALAVLDKAVVLAHAAPD